MCPKCGSVFFEQEEDIYGWWKHCRCGNQWDHTLKTAKARPETPTDEDRPMNDKPMEMDTEKCGFGQCNWKPIQEDKDGKFWCKRHPDGKPIPIPRTPWAKKESPAVKKAPEPKSKEEVIPSEPMAESPKANGRPKHLVESAAYLRATAAQLKKEVKVLEDAADALDHVYALNEK